MNGFYLKHKNDCLEKVKEGSYEFSLLAKGEGTEIMIQKFEQNKSFSMYPSENEDTLEFFYVLKGSLLLEADKHSEIIDQGDYIYLKGLSEVKIFKTLTEVELLYVSTEPIFSYMSKQMKEFMNIVKQVEEKDFYTYNHGRRVQDYSVAIGKKLQISKERLEVLLGATILHDIGKINVPIDVLNKPGKLTDDEFQSIKKHASEGEKLVGETYLKDLGKIISQHHERLDGSGYPNGLKGEEICLEARIIAVCDTYDAMTTDRPYRGRLSPQIAIDELKRLCGIHYDNQVVEVFKEILIKEGTI